MLANTYFSMRITKREKRMIAQIAKSLQRSQSDALKVIIRKEYETLQAKQSDPTNAPREYGGQPIQA